MFYIRTAKILTILIKVSKCKTRPKNQKRDSTKNDLGQFFAKNDLGPFIAKNDLGPFLAKNDLGPFLAKNDLGT